MPFPELITQRLRLRAWQEADFEPHVLWEADPRVTEFLPFLHVPRTAEASHDHIARFLATPLEKRQAWAREWVRAEAEKSWPWWAIEAAGITEVIGAVGLGIHTFESDFTPCVEIGWRFAPKYWGQGYATEAAKAVLRYAFTTMGLTEIFSMSALGNKRSFALMERIGLRRERDIQWPLLPEGHPLRPYALYKLRREDWSRLEAHPGSKC